MAPEEESGGGKETGRPSATIKSVTMRKSSSSPAAAVSRSTPGRKSEPTARPEPASALKTQRAQRDRERSSPPPARAAAVKVLHAGKLAAIPWLLHGFSTRQGGVSEAYGGRQLNLGPTAEDAAENVERNRARFLRKLRALDDEGNPWPLVVLNQVHSAVTHRVYGARGPEWAGLRITLRKGNTLETAGDGLITNAAGVLLAVKVADCLPVIVADRRRRAVGIFHAGWRGTVQRIVEKGVGEMRRQLGCRPEDLLAAIGPGIGACCYEIGEQVEDEFDSQFAYAKELFTDVFDSWSLKTKYPMLFLNQRAPGHGEPALSRHLDLVEANRRQLRDAGVPEENIESLGLCTACRTDLFFSYRREHVTGRMLAVVGIR
jgi:purine-nucleoside/S-methyl-5'-thioadenosine phosphorylase / adenosine deaminase